MAGAKFNRRTHPLYGETVRRIFVFRKANGGFKPEDQPQKLGAGEVKAVHVQGNVHLIVGAGANIAVQVGEDGVLVVDTGAAGSSEKVLNAIKQLAPNKEIRWIINTGVRPDHIGGNESISRAGRTVNGNVAAIVSQIVGQGLIAYAFAHLPASLSSVSLLIQPVMATLFAWIIFGERVGVAKYFFFLDS